MLGFFICICALLGLYQGVIHYGRIPAAFSPVFMISCIGLILYIGALTNHLFMAYVFLVIAGITNFSFTFMRYFLINNTVAKNHHFYDTVRYLTLIFISMLITVTGTHLLKYPDEIHFWGPLVQFIHWHNQLPIPKTAHFRFLDYPPGAALFQYFILNLLRTYNDAFLYFAQDLMIFSCVFIVTAMKDWKKSTVAILLFMLVLSDFRATFLYCIYVDTLVACFFAAIVMIKHLSRESKNKTLLITLPIFCFLILIKQVAFPMALLAVVILAIDHDIKRPSYVLLLCVITAACFLTHYSWVWHYHQMGVHKTFQTNSISLFTVFHDLFSATETQAHFILKQFLLAFFVFAKNFSRLTISPFLTMILIGWLYHFIFKKLKQQKQATTLPRYEAILLFICAISYSAGLLILYWQSYSFVEAKQLASVGRYLDIYFIGWTMIVVTQCVNLCKFTSKRSTTVILICIGLSISAIAISAQADSKKAAVFTQHTDYYHSQISQSTESRPISTDRENN